MTIIRPRVARLASVLLPLLLAGCVVLPVPPAERRDGREVPVPRPSRAEAPGVEAEVLRLMNAGRRRAGLAELVLDPVLGEVARRHSRDMRDRDFFDHADPAGRTMRERLRAAGVPYREAAENVAHVYDVPDPAAYMHRILMESPPHRRNLLHPRVTRVGIGVARRGTAYWLTEVFVRP